MAEEPLTPDQELALELAKFYDDPLGHVMFSYPWDTDKTIQIVKLQSPWKERFPNCEYGPDVWACEFLDDIGAETKARNFNGVDAVSPLRYSTGSGHGIGKSVMVAWIIKWIMDTRPLSIGTVTANTDTQLRTKTWAELGKWHKLSATEHWFDFSTGRGAMALKHKEHREKWAVSAQTSRKENSEGFAGQHSVSATSFYIFDEASGIDSGIFDVREGGLTDGEPMIFDFGNPTRNSGAFYENCVGKYAHKYKVRMIDSRTVAITNKKLIADWAAERGEDSDFFKIRVKGEFPSQSSWQFISAADVDTAMNRELPQQVSRDATPLVFGVDVARKGTNESVIQPRLGNDARSWPAKTFTGLKTTELVDKIIEEVKFFRKLGLKVAAIFVDGGGVGGGVVDQLERLGYPVVEVLFGGKPQDGKVYRFKGDEMWGKLRSELQRGLCLPMNHDKGGKELKEQLTQREFSFTLQGNKIWLETKEEMELRGLESPDRADALVLTYARDVSAAVLGEGRQGETQSTVHEYDPLTRKD